MSITHITKHSYICMLIATLILCSGCSLHLQRLDDFPTTLSTVYITQPSTYDHGFTQGLSRFFTRMQANIVKSSELSPITITPSTIRYTSEIKALTSGSNAISTTYKLYVTISVLDKQGHTILGPKSFSNSETLSQNSTIINTSANNTLMYSQLTHAIIPRITAWLTSDNSQNTLQIAIEHSHDH